MNAAYEKQALENAAAAVQHSQSAKVNTRHFNGMEIKGTSTGLSIDGKAAAVIEKIKTRPFTSRGFTTLLFTPTVKLPSLRTACLKATPNKSADRGDMLPCMPALPRFKRIALLLVIFTLF
jgi:hypothetical protein